jgi:hypothetical protein
LLVFKIVKGLLYYATDGLLVIFLTLASINIQLWILLTLALVNITQPKKRMVFLTIGSVNKPVK